MDSVVVIGHSHIAALRRGYHELYEAQVVNFAAHFIALRSEEFSLAGGAEGERSSKLLASKVSGVNKPAVLRAVAAANADAAILCLNGNEHNVFGLFKDLSMSCEEKCSRLNDRARPVLSDWIQFLKPTLPAIVVLTLPPPPIEAEERIRLFPGNHEVRFKGAEIEPANTRLELWRQQCKIIQSVGKEYGIPVIGLPESIFSASGFLVLDCWGKDPAHGNTEYGKRILLSLIAPLEEMITNPERRAPVTTNSAGSGGRHPYVGLADYRYWKQSISDLDSSAVDPVTSPRFKILPKDKVATAGSCFAQHISKRLRDSGFNFFVAEKAEGDEEEGRVRGFYDFSARYGNVYTSRQLVQLFDRAFGYFKPIDTAWPRNGGGFCDPFRPRIEPDGFASEAEVVKDSKRHLAAVRKMFTRLDVFVFTLGLTECWVSRLDGAAYPMAPGVAGGEYDPEKYAFVNLGAAEVTADLRVFLQKLKLVNPRARVILTVSPVPLVATAEDRHILVSTTYSKSVLRVAAEEIVNSHDNVYYFPSYEIITGQHIGNAYYGPDKRSVTERGVDHVMGVFMSRLTEQKSDLKSANRGVSDRTIAEMEELVEVACDEEMLVR